jgi:hypothetical protein
VSGGAFLGDAKPQGLDIWWIVDHVDSCATELYMEHIVFTQKFLPYVSVIIVFMRVSLVELQFQMVMGHVLILKCMLSGVRGLL